MTLEERTEERIKELIGNNETEELNKLINDEDWHVRQAVAKQGYGLEKLVNDEVEYVRRVVAEQGYGLDRLVNDKDNNVRVAVVEGAVKTERTDLLDKLIHDEDWWVRAAVAKQGYALEKLINDESWYVRQAVASQGYGLNILVNDEDWRVRRVVAKQGYGLDRLVNDEIEFVREAVAKQGYGLDVLIDDEDERVRAATINKAKKTGFDLNKPEYINSEYWDVRAEVASQGYGLDRLVNDEDWEVREAVAEQGYGLDVLINDEDWNVRDIAIDKAKKTGFDFNKSEYINSPYEYVREAVAEQFLYAKQKRDAEYDIENKDVSIKKTKGFISEMRMFNDAEKNIRNGENLDEVRKLYDISKDSNLTEEFYKHKNTFVNNFMKFVSDTPIDILNKGGIMDFVDYHQDGNSTNYYDHICVFDNQGGIFTILPPLVENSPYYNDLYAVCEHFDSGWNNEDREVDKSYRQKQYSEIDYDNPLIDMVNEIDELICESENETTEDVSIQESCETDNSFDEQEENIDEESIDDVGDDAR